MSKQITAVLRLVLILIILLGCAAAAVGGLALVGLPRLAAQKFGSESTRLSLPQRTLYAARLLLQEKSLLTPLDPKGKPREFEVTLGESVNAISTHLEEDRFIANADAFRTYLIYAGLDTGVRAGKYQISPAMNIIQIAHAFQNAVSDEVQFNILPGWRAEEIAAALPTSGLDITPDAFMQIVNSPPADILPVDFPNIDTLEGFMLPGQYQVKRTVSAQDLAALFLKRFDRTLTPDLRQEFSQNGLDLAQAVILASIVQREAVVADEQPIIASVFYNRMAEGMKLESDPTVQYALGYDTLKQTWWKNPLSQSDLQVDSRYNTYMVIGLPPGPISNPSMEVLRAVARPAQTDYFYFRAKCDGSGRHAFSATFEQHLQNGCP